MANPAISSVKYGAIGFTLASVSYSGQAVYDENEITLMGYLMTFSVRCYEHATSPSEFVTRLHEIQKELGTPRLQFTWESDGTNIWDISEAGGGGEYEDRRFGPKPRNVRIQQITGGLSAKIEFDIECFIIDCDTGSAKDVEEFWWRFSYAYDRNFTCSRTITGQIRHSRQPSVDIPQHILQETKFWPPLPKGFYRDNYDYQISADGLVYTFTITDRQVWRTLPVPLTAGNATFRIEQNGGTVSKTLTCSFEAPIDVQKQVILQYILALLKMRFPGILNPPGILSPMTEIVRVFSITNDEFNNRMECTVVSTSGAGTLRDAAGTFVIPETLFGDIEEVLPDSADNFTGSDGISYLKETTGTAKLAPEFGADPYVLCDNETEAHIEVDKNGVLPAAGTNTNNTLPGFQTIAPDSILDDEHQKFPYVVYREYVEIEVDHHIVIHKIAGSDDTDNGDFVQQVAKPSINMIVVGFARRLGMRPHPGEFPVIDTGGYGNQKLYIKNRKIRLESPKLTADARTLEYALGWSYTMSAPYEPGTDIQSFLIFPANRQLTQQANIDAQASNNFWGGWHQVVQDDGEVDPETAGCPNQGCPPPDPPLP